MRKLCQGRERKALHFILFSKVQLSGSCSPLHQMSNLSGLQLLHTSYHYSLHKQLFALVFQITLELFRQLTFCIAIQCKLLIILIQEMPQLKINLRETASVFFPNHLFVNDKANKSSLNTCIQFFVLLKHFMLLSTVSYAYDCASF